MAIFRRRYLDGRDWAKKNDWLVTGQLIWYYEWLRIRSNTHLQNSRLTLMRQVAARELCILLVFKLGVDQPLE